MPDACLEFESASQLRLVAQRLVEGQLGVDRSIAACYLGLLREDVDRLLVSGELTLSTCPKGGEDFVDTASLRDYASRGASINAMAL